MGWVCPSCGFDHNHDSCIRCSCGYEIVVGEERNYTKRDGALDTEHELASYWTGEHFIAGFLISFFIGFIWILFDFFDSSRFSWSWLGIAFVISLGVGFFAGVLGRKFIQFLFELIRWI